jgi:hypothetical protein
MNKTIKSKTLIQVSGFVFVLAAIGLSTLLLHNDNKVYALRLDQIHTDRASVADVRPDSIGPIGNPHQVDELPNKYDEARIRQTAVDKLPQQPPPFERIDWKTIQQQEPHK